MNGTKYTYRERHYIDRFRCYDIMHSVILYDTWQVGGIIYGYKRPGRDICTVMCLSLDDITAVEPP